MTLVAGKWRCLFITGDDNEVNMVTPKTTEQHLTVCSGKY